MEDLSNLSDGYHTFAELYEHRAVLFALAVKNNISISWKSNLHHDGTMFEDYFIVGMQTKYGQISYHFHKNKWNMFLRVIELDRAPEWDGHTSDDVVSRLTKLIMED